MGGNADERLRGRRKRMAKWVLVMAGIGILLAPAPSPADCISMQGYSFVLIKNDRELVVYRGNHPIAEMRLRNCRLSADSGVFFTRGLMCDGDIVLVDGERCETFSVKSTAFEHGP
jgi:hypothetical protein